MQTNQKTIDFFKEVFLLNPELEVHAPGRVNLIGEHTDYNEGYVLPVAIDRKIVYLASPRKDRTVILYSSNFREKEEFSLDSIPSKKSNWGDYARGAIKIFSDKGYPLQGMNVLIEGDVPIASGLSSSAAMEVGMSVLLKKMNDLDITPIEIIKSSQKAENVYVGVSCGIMDQFASCLGKENNALFLDCRSLECKDIPLNLDKIKLVVCNTKVKRELKDTAFNARRQECSDGVKMLKKYMPLINSLRDVGVKDFEKYKENLPQSIARRCSHVITEDQRVIDSVKLLQDSKIREFAGLLYKSHESLRDLYEVSCPELDAMVDISLETKGVLGSRMTGAGFGGCTIALVEENYVEEFCAAVKEQYIAKTGIIPEIYPCLVSNGAMN